MIRIITDTAADFTAIEAEELGIDVVRMSIGFPGLVYNQEEDTDFSTFFALLKTSKQFPKTSQPSPEVFAKLFQQAKDAGDSVIAILISSGLSGTYQAAQIAADTVKHPQLHLIDTKTAIMGQRILVEHAVSMRREGKPFEDIVREVNGLCGRVKVFGMIETLTYLYKGGRLSKTVAIAGNLLHIKPLVAVKGGVVKLVGKGRGFQTLLQKLVEGAGFDAEYPVYFGYIDTSETCIKMMKHAREQFHLMKTGMFSIGALIGAHVGPGGYGIAFVARE